MPVLANVLDANGWGEYTTLTFMVLPLSAIISPLVIGARADQTIAAEKLLAILVGGGSVLAWIAFSLLEQGEHPFLFILLFGLNALVTAPAWSLLNTITLSSTEFPERDFGKYRVWGTLGWLAAGWMVSALSLDLSPSVGKLTVGARLLGAACCLLLPHTPPRGGPPKNAWEVMGFGALRVFKQRSTAVFFWVAFLFSIPLAAFYMHTPLQLRALGCERVAAVMTVGQFTEIVAMLMMGWFLQRWRPKWLFAVALGCGMLRYMLYVYGAQFDFVLAVLLGVALHGICWSYFFEVGRVFVEKRVDQGIRAQSQALLSLLTGGIGGLVGTAVVGWAHGLLVDDATGSGWNHYWCLLAAMCGVCLAGFLISYREKPDSEDKIGDSG